MVVVMVMAIVKGMSEVAGEVGSVKEGASMQGMTVRQHRDLQRVSERHHCILCDIPNKVLIRLIAVIHR